MSDLQSSIEGIERALAMGDLSKLSVEQRVAFLKKTCESLGLNPLTKPFEYITLNGKLTLYAKKDATDQLRKIHNVSIEITSREKIGDVYVVTARATSAGRTDESIGAVSIVSQVKMNSQGKQYGGEILSGDALCNAIMKCESKAKRRVTLSICGLGMLDESEIETIPKESREIKTDIKEIPKEPLPKEIMKVSEDDLSELKKQFKEKFISIAETAEQKKQLAERLGITKFSDLDDLERDELVSKLNKLKEEYEAFQRGEN